MLSIGLGQSLVFTSIPIFARENGLNEVEVSLIFGISAFAWFFASPFWGRYSEKLGSRTVGIIGSIGYSANMILIILPLFLFEKGYITSGILLPALIASRLIYGIFGSATRPTACQVPKHLIQGGAYVGDAWGSDRWMGGGIDA